MKAKYKVSICIMSDIGNKRIMNQDNFFCSGGLIKPIRKSNYRLSNVTRVVNRPLLLGVFDGMGGERHGEIASFVAAKTAQFWDRFRREDDLRALCYKANQNVVRTAEKKVIGTMGTTAALMRLTNESLYFCNLGDSRIYEIDEYEINQVSKDHVLRVNENEKGPLYYYLGLPEKEAIFNPHYVISNTKEATYLLCTDGLTDMLSNDTILDIVAKHEITEASDKLLHEALEQGGRDNITFILCKIEKI